MFREIEIKELNHFLKNTMVGHLSIEISKIASDSIEAKMPVNAKTHQPMGFLHGGASLALAESIGSIASYLIIDPEKYHTFGLEINANHIKSKRDGEVKAIARPIHLGNRTHIWDIKIVDEKGDLISICRLTNMIVHARK